MSKNPAIEDLDIEIGNLKEPQEHQPLLTQVNQSFQKTADKTNRHFSAMGIVLAATTVLAALMTKKDLMSDEVMENTHVIMGAVALAGTLVMTGLALGSRQQKRQLLEIIKEDKEVFSALRTVGKMLAKNGEERTAVEEKFKSLSGHLVEVIENKMQENKPLECAGRLISCVKTDNSGGDINPDKLEQMIAAASKAAETKNDRYLAAAAVATVILGASLIAVACGRDDNLSLSFMALGGLAPLAAGVASKRGQYNENALAELKNTIQGMNFAEFANLKNALNSAPISPEAVTDLDQKLTQLSEYFSSYQKFREGVVSPTAGSNLKAILAAEKNNEELIR